MTAILPCSWWHTSFHFWAGIWYNCLANLLSKFCNVIMIGMMSLWWHHYESYISALAVFRASLWTPQSHFKTLRFLQWRLLSPKPPIVRATKAGGFIKNFYVLIDTLPPKRTTALSYPPVTLTPQVPQQGHLDDPDDQNDVLMDIITSSSRSPVLVRRLDPPVESVPVMGIIVKMGSSTPKTLPILPRRLLGPSASHYQGTPWENNSCWLDSGEWEALYAVSLYDRAFWKWDFDSAPLTYPLESRIGDLRRSFTAKNLVYSYASQKEVPGLLRKIRNGYHQRLVMPKGNAPLDKIGDQELPFVSLVSYRNESAADFMIIN